MAKRREDLETQDVACLWVEITPNKGKCFLIGSLYRNPAEWVEWVDHFEMSLENVLNDKKEIILLGDFNKDLLNLHGNRDWLILFESLGLSQLTTQPARVTNNSSSLIGQIYSSDEDNQTGISVHFAVFCNRKINASLKKNSHKSITYRSFKHFDKIEFLHDLQLVLWSNINEFENIDDILEAWYVFFTDTTCINKHAPVKNHRIKNDIQPDWLAYSRHFWLNERKGYTKNARWFWKI